MVYFLFEKHTVMSSALFMKLEKNLKIFVAMKKNYAAQRTTKWRHKDASQHNSEMNKKQMQYWADNFQNFTLTMGVINSSRNGNFKSSGQLWWMKLMSNPLMCEPSWSWSVMIISRPYRKALRSSIERYFLPYCNPMILTMLLISAFSINYEKKLTL